MFIPDPGSDFFPSRIPDPNCLHPGSASKNLGILTPKKPKKWFLSSRKYDPGCSSRTPDPDADFLPIPGPGSRIQGSKRHRIPDPDPQHWFECPFVYPSSGFSFFRPQKRFIFFLNLRIFCPEPSSRPLRSVCPSWAASGRPSSTCPPTRPRFRRVRKRIPISSQGQSQGGKYFAYSTVSHFSLVQYMTQFQFWNTVFWDLVRPVHLEGATNIFRQEKSQK